MVKPKGARAVFLETLVKRIPNSSRVTCIYCTFEDNDGIERPVEYNAVRVRRKKGGGFTYSLIIAEVMRHFTSGRCTRVGVQYHQDNLPEVEVKKNILPIAQRHELEKGPPKSNASISEDIALNDSTDLIECACGETFLNAAREKIKYIGHVRKCIAYSSWHANFLKLELVGGPLLPGVSEVKFYNGKPVFKSAAVLYVHVKPAALITLPKYFIADCLAYVGIVKIHVGLTMEASFVTREKQHERMGRLSSGLMFGILEGSAEDMNFIEMVCHVTPKPLSNSGDHSNYSKYLTGRSEDEIKAAYNTVINALRTLFFKLKDEEIKAGRMRSNLETSINSIDCEIDEIGQELSKFEA